VEELSTALRSWYKHMGVSRSLQKVQEEVEVAMTKHDADHSGTLDWLEFIRMWRDGAEFFKFKLDATLADQVLQAATTELRKESEQWLRLLQEEFEAFDRNRSGRLDIDELTQLLRSTYKKRGISTSLQRVNEEVVEAMGSCDREQTGKVDWSGFVKMWAAGKPLKFNVEGAVRHAVWRTALRGGTFIV